MSVGDGGSGGGRRRNSEWAATCEAVVAKLQAMAETSEDQRKKNERNLMEMSDQVWELVSGVEDVGPREQKRHAPKLLRAVLGLMDLKDPRCLFRLSRCALVLLRVEGAVQGVHASGVQAAYLNIAKVLFKCSKSEGHDGDFLQEGLIEPLLEVLRSEASECASGDLRVYIVGVLKNISNDEANLKYLVQRGAPAAMFGLMRSEQLTGNSKEAQLLIQITATLRNLAGHHYKHLVQEERLEAFTRMMALFPGNVELLTNISRILAKLTLHASACEAFEQSDAHIRQIARTLSANIDSAPLALRLAFVLGNLTAKSDRLRVIFAFDCEGTSLVPQLLGKYWAKDRQLARLEVEKGQAKVAGTQEVEEVLVKLVRLLANIAISASAGATLASSSAAVDPLLDALGAKRIGDSEELVLNVVAAVTNLLFYDVPSNLLFEEENKQLLCRLFRPLLLESYNVEALVETARALGNLSRHADARRCMTGLRLDEILVILLDHDDRDLVFYVCGALVNLAADPDCIERLTGACPTAQKLGKLLRDAPASDAALQLVAAKVLTNLSLDPGVQWAASDLEAVRGALDQIIAVDAGEDTDERQQLGDLGRQLLARLPTPEEEEREEEEPGVDEPTSAALAPQPASSPQAKNGGAFVCQVDGCGRSFGSEAKLQAHRERRHPNHPG